MSSYSAAEISHDPPKTEKYGAVEKYLPFCDLCLNHFCFYIPQMKQGENRGVTWLSVRSLFWLPWKLSVSLGSSHP